MRRLTLMSLLLAFAVSACDGNDSTALDGTSTRDPNAPGSASLNVDLDQWANGTDSKTPEWQNGNLNGNNSAYAERRVVPFRLAIEGLEPGQHTIHINHDFTAGGRKAYEFLASIDATEPLSETGYSTVEAWLCGSGGGAVSSLCTSEGGPGLGTYHAKVFPYDPFNGTPYLSFVRQVGGGLNGLMVPGTIDGTPTAVQLSGLPDNKRELRIYGGTVDDIQIPTHDGPLDGNSSADLVVTFTSTGSAVLLTWGGHLACSLCWESILGGELNGASQISGAPWHMRTQNLDGGGASNQDRSIQPSAVVPPGRLDGYKYHDLNANGTRDEGEPGLEGWEIRAQSTLGLLIDTTDASGYFAFESLPADTFTVSEVCPTDGGWSQSEPTPTNGCGSGVHSVEVFNDSTTTVLFGNYRAPVKAGHKFHDLDADGVWDEGEPPLEGWTIQAWQGTTLVTSTTTDSTGAYHFDLMPGVFTVREVCPEGWFQSFPAASAGCGSGTYEVVLGSGQVDDDNDFGNYRLATKSGHKFHDLDADGVWDEGEPGLDGWAIRVTGTDGMGNAVDDTVSTDSLGAYSFALVPGSYTVAEICPVNGWIQSFPAPTDGCGTGVHNVTLTSNQVDSGNDFGNYEQAVKAGHKFHDLDADGVWDEGEPPLEGWTIQAWQGTTLVTSTTTDSTGAYSLSLEPGVYTVREVCGEGWLQSLPAPTDGCGSGTYQIDLTSGESEADNDFGNYRLATKSGHKFHDLDADGVWDEGEPGLDGWAIRVTGTDGMGNAVDDTVSTDSLGAYSFALVPGSYTVAEICPVNGWIQSFPAPTDGCGTGVHNVTLTSNQVDSGNDFGNYAMVALSGFKFHDVGNDGDMDGMPDAEDTPIEGWVIMLFEDADSSGNWTMGDPLVDSVTTGIDGSYRFDGLMPGMYVVCEVTRDSWIESYPGNGACGDGSNGLESGGYAADLPSGHEETNDNFFNTGEIEGCTPGYWKNHVDRWVGHAYDDRLDSVFSATPLGGFASNTLLEALNFGGGSGVNGARQILLRAAVASLLNFAHPDVEFLVPEQGSWPSIATESGLIDAVNAALSGNDRETMLGLATHLDDANNAVNMCPLEGTRAFRPS